MNYYIYTIKNIIRTIILKPMAKYFICSLVSSLTTKKVLKLKKKI